jgi:hypothetical protein
VLVAFDVGVELVGEKIAERLLELAEVLDGVRALPLRVLPLLDGHVLVAGQAGPVGLDELPIQRVREGLLRGVRARFAVLRPFLP